MPNPTCRALAIVYRELENDRLEPTKARVMIYCALSLSTVLSEHDLEARIMALETQTAARRTDPLLILVQGVQISNLTLAPVVAGPS